MTPMNEYIKPKEKRKRKKKMKPKTQPKPKQQKTIENAETTSLNYCKNDTINNTLTSLDSGSIDEIRQLEPKSILKPQTYKDKVREEDVSNSDLDMDVYNAQTNNSHTTSHSDDQWSIDTLVNKRKDNEKTDNDYSDISSDSLESFSESETLSYKTCKQCGLSHRRETQKCPHTGLNTNETFDSTASSKKTTNTLKQAHIKKTKQKKQDKTKPRKYKLDKGKITSNEQTTKQHKPNYSQYSVKDNNDTSYSFTEYEKNKTRNKESDTELDNMTKLTLVDDTPFTMAEFLDLFDLDHLSNEHKNLLHETFLEQKRSFCNT